MDPLGENGSRGSGLPRKPALFSFNHDDGAKQDGAKAKEGGQFFRVPRPPSKGKPTFLSQRRDSVPPRGTYETQGGIQVRVGVTTGVELVLLLGESPQNTDELSHHVYYFLESEPANVINRNPYELVLANKADCNGQDFYTITRSGVTEFSRRNGTETTSLLDWLKFRNMFNLINKDPFRFPLMKGFKIYKAFAAWKCAARIWKMESAREKLKVNLLLLHPQFNTALLHIQEVVLSCALEGRVDAVDEAEAPSPLKKTPNEERLLSAFSSAIEAFEENTRAPEQLGKRLHQCFIECNRQIGELLGHIQMIVNTVCKDFNEIQFSSDKEQSWMDKISDVDLTMRDITFMFPQRSPNRSQHSSLNENIVEIFSKSQNQQKIIIHFVRLVEVVIASAIAETMMKTTEQIHNLIMDERSSIVTLKTHYEAGSKGDEEGQAQAPSVSIEPSLRALVKFFTKPYRDMADVSAKLKRPLVFPLTKNNEVPMQFQRKNFVSLKDLVSGFGISIDDAGAAAEAHIRQQYDALCEQNASLLQIPESDAFREAMEESLYISSGRVEELKLNPLAFSKNLIVIRDWLDLIEGSTTESRVDPLSLDLLDLKSNLHEDLTVAYNLFVDRLHDCLEYHGRHTLDEMIYNSYDIKTLSDDLQLFVDECVRVEQDAYSTEDRVNIIGNFFASLRKVLKYVDKSDTFNQRLEENFSTAEVLMNEVERLLRNKITVRNAPQIKQSWSKFLDEKANYKRTLRTLSKDIVNHSRVYVNQLLVTVDCFCEEIQAIEERLSSDDSFDATENMEDTMQKSVSLQLMKIETEIKKKGETSDNLQDMLRWWINTQQMLQGLNPGSKGDEVWQKTDAIKASKERGKGLFEHVSSIFHWKKKFWLSDILIWMEIYERLTTIRPFSSDLSNETLEEVNGAVQGHIEILNDRLRWALESGFACKETKLIREIIQAGGAWVNTLQTFNDMISNPNHPSSVQLRHRLTVEMKRKSKSLLECTLADIHGRSASGFSVEKNQVKQEEDNYGKALFDLFHIERQMRGMYFMINSRVSSNGSIHLITNFMEIFQSIEKAEQVIVSVSALAESFKSVEMGENTRELHIEMSRMSNMIRGIRHSIEVLYQAQSYYLLFSRLSSSNTFFKCAGIGYVNDCISIKQRWMDEIITPLTSQKQVSILSASEEMDIKLGAEESPATLMLGSLHDLYDEIVDADVLVVAREAFPRLYFVSDRILLHSIAYEDDPQKLLKDFFRLCYSGVARVDVKESEIVLEGAKNQPLEIQEKHVDAIYGEGGERIALTDPLLFSHSEGAGILNKAPQTKSESKPDELTVWAVKLAEEIRSTMRASLAECHAGVGAMDVEEWMDRFPLQSVWLANEIAFVAHVESQLPSRGGRFPALADQMSRKVSSLSSRLVHLYSVEKEFKMKIRKAEALVYSGICHRDIAQHLAEHRVVDASDFSWQKFVRYYWNQEKDTCHVACGFSLENEQTGFEYGFEYLGDDFTSRLFGEGLSLTSNAVLGLAHATFGCGWVTPISEVVGAGAEGEVIRAVAMVCGKHLVAQDASLVPRRGSEKQWQNILMACRRSKSWMQLEGVDWLDLELVSRLTAALDECRRRLSSDLVLSKEYSSVRYFVPTDQAYGTSYRSGNSPLEKVARRCCVIDWSFQIAFEAAIELKLRYCGQKGDMGGISKEVAAVLSSVVKMMHKYLAGSAKMNSHITVSKQIVQQVMSHDIDLGNCRFVILNALKKGLGQFLPKAREVQVEELYWQLLAGHTSNTTGEEEALANFDLHTETDQDLNQYLRKNQLEKGYAFYGDRINSKCLQMLDAISENSKSIVVTGSPGSGKSALINLVFEAFETKLMKNRSSVRKIYTDSELERLEFLVSDDLLTGAREAHRLKLLLVEVTLAGQRAGPIHIVDQNVILDGELSNTATLAALKQKISSEAKGYTNIPRFILECVSIDSAAPSLLAAVHLVHCGQNELLSPEKYWECSLEAFGKRFGDTALVGRLDFVEVVRATPVLDLLVRYVKAHSVVNAKSNEMVSDVFRCVRVFFDLLGYQIETHMTEIEIMTSNSRDKTVWDLVRLLVYCLAWSLESQLLRLEDKGWKGLERMIVQPILDLHLPGQELGLDVSHILDYDVAVTSSGHFHLAVLEDPAAIHPTEEDEENVHIAGGVIVTNRVFLQRKMLHRWIHDFRYDVLVIGGVSSSKRLLMGDIASRSGVVARVLSNALDRLPQHCQEMSKDQRKRVVLIEDLHVSEQAPCGRRGQETLRKFMDAKKHRMAAVPDGEGGAGDGGRHQYVCCSLPSHCDGLRQRFCSERLFHHFYRFGVSDYEMRDITNIFVGEILLSVCTEYGISEKGLKQGCQTLIMSLITMVKNLFERAGVAFVDPQATKSPKLLSQMYNYLEISVHHLVSLRREQLADIKEWGKVLVENLHCLHFSGLAYSHVQSSAVDLCNDPIMNFLKDSPAIVNVADDVEACVKAKERDGSTEWKIKPVDPALVEGALRDLCAEKGWLSSIDGVGGLAATREAAELGFWAEMLSEDLRRVTTHVNFKKKAHPLKVLVVESSADITCLGHPLKLAEISAHLTAARKGATFVKFAAGEDNWDGILAEAQETPMVISMSEEDLSESGDLESALLRFTEERPYVTMEVSAGQIQVILQCKQMRPFLKRLLRQAPLLLRFSETCTLPQEAAHTRDFVRGVVEATFDRTLSKITETLSEGVDPPEGVRETLVTHVLDAYESSLAWHRGKDARILKDEPSSRCINPLGLIFEHAYLSAWLLANCLRSNEDATRAVQGQLAALSSLDVALDTATLQYREVQHDFEKTLDRTSSLLLSIAEQKHVIEEREFNHAAEDFALKARVKKIDQGKKKAQMRIETSYQSFLKGVESVLNVSEMEMEDVRMNSKPPKLVQRVARACAYVLSLNHPKTSDEVAKIKKMDWAELNQSLFSRIRIYDQTSDSRISFFKREIDTFPMDQILDRVRNQYEEVEEAMEELNNLLMLPDFKLHRVEQVSKALKPLCAWILAVHEHLKESLELDRLEVDQNRCQTEVRMFENLNSLRETDEVNTLKRQLANLRKNYEICTENFTALEVRKRNLEYYIETSKLLIEKVQSWRAYCEAALAKLGERRALLGFEIAFAGSLVVYASFLDKMERDHLKGCWRDSSDHVLESCGAAPGQGGAKILEFDLHDFLRRNFTHEWFLDETRTAVGMLDLCNQSTLNLGSRTHLAESIAIAWLARRALGKTCVFIDPEEICRAYAGAWEASQERLGGDAPATPPPAFTCARIGKLPLESEISKISAEMDEDNVLLYVQSTSFPHDHFRGQGLAEALGAVHFVDLTLREPRLVYNGICTMLSRFCGEELPPLVSLEKSRLPVQEMEDDLQVLLLRLGESKRRLCRTFKAKSYSEFISQKDSDLTIDLKNLHRLKKDISTQLEQYDALSNSFERQCAQVASYFGTLPAPIVSFGRRLSTLFASAGVSWGYFHGCPLSVFLNVLERKVFAKLPLSAKEAGSEGRRAFLARNDLQAHVTRSMFDLLVTQRYLSSDWILKTMHLSFHFEYLSESFAEGKAPGSLRLEEWDFFLDNFLGHCVSQKGVDKRTNLALAAGDRGWGEKIAEAVEAFSGGCPDPGAFDSVREGFGKMRKLGMELPLEEVLKKLDQALAESEDESRRHWRFAAVLFVVGSCHREQELVALWLMRRIITMDYATSSATQSAVLADQMEILDNRIPLLLGSTSVNSLQVSKGKAESSVSLRRAFLV